PPSLLSDETSLPLHQFHLTTSNDHHHSLTPQQTITAQLDLTPYLKQFASSPNFSLAQQQPDNNWLTPSQFTHQSNQHLHASLTSLAPLQLVATTDAWTPPIWNQPTTAPFSGAATYQYPLDLPLGRNNLQPDLTLRYNSRGLDGRIEQTGNTTIADGWSLATISIIRTGITTEYNGTTPYINHPNSFRLIFNGASHALFTTDDPQAPTARYYADNQPGWQIWRHYDPEAPNFDKLFWTVITADGRHYRLGYTPDAEQWHQVTAGYHINIDGHPGQNDTAATALTSAFAWHLDTVTDPFGNQMQYTYFTHPIAKEFLTTRHNRLHHIQYNFPDRVTNLPPTPTTTRLTTTPATRIEFRRAQDDTNPNQAIQPVQNIFIFHGPQQQQLTEYRLDTQSAFADSPNCTNGLQRPLRTRTHILKSIQRFSQTNHSPNDADEGYTLPPTTFTYTPLPHAADDCFPFMYLTTIDNGYGGQFTFTYQADNRVIGTFDNTNPNHLQYPDYGYSYFVTNQTAHDGLNSTTQTFTYDTPCYSQYDPDVTGHQGGLPNAHPCYQFDDHQYGPLAGFATVTHNYFDFDNTLQKSIETTFSQQTFTNNNLPVALLGRPLTQNHRDPLGHTLSTITNQYHHTPFANNLQFVYTAAITHTQHNPHDSAQLHTLTTYDYPLPLQGNNQYGLNGLIYNHGNLSTAKDDTTIINCFYPLTTNSWLPHQQGVHRTFRGLLPATSITSTLCDQELQHPNLLRSELYQRDHASYNTPTYPAAPTATIVGLWGHPTTDSPTGLITTEQYQYNEFGQLTTTTNALGHQTTTHYDPAYHLYPLKTINPLGHQTTQTIIGFPDLDGNTISSYLLANTQQPAGAVYQITTIPVQTQTFEYDPFGRVWAVYDTTADQADPANRWDGTPQQRYRYWDNNWNDPNIQYLAPANNAPFLITHRTQPNQYPSTNHPYLIRTNTYYDGFTRPIQTNYSDQKLDTNGQAPTRHDLITTTSYDYQGNTACTSLPYAGNLYTTYDPTPCAQAPNGAQIERFDSHGRLLSTTTPNGDTNTYTYLIKTNIPLADDTLTLQRQRHIDPQGYLQHTFQQPSGQIELIRAYSGQTDATYALDHEIQYRYNPLGQLLNTYRYNHLGQLRHATSRTYNHLGQLTDHHDPDMGHWQYQYDRAGQLIRQNANDDHILCFYYDKIGRPLRRTNDPNPTTSTCPAYAQAPTNGPDHLATYTYDTAPNALGQLHATNWGPNPTANHENYTYNGHGRLISHQRTINNHTFTLNILSFDTLDRPQQYQYPDGEILTLTYNQQGLSQLRSDDDPLVTAVSYNPLGQRTSLAYGHGLTQRNQFYTATGHDGNNNFRWQAKTLFDANDKIIFNLQFTYNQRGNLTTIRQDEPGLRTQWHLYSYDHLQRLITAQGPGYHQNYQYDTLGNIIAQTDSLNNNTLTYDYTPSAASNQHPQAVKSLWQNDRLDTTFTYDDHGNMTHLQTSDRQQTHTFNSQNQLVTTADENGQTHFEYDSHGQRLLTIHGDGRRTYHPFPQYEETHYDCGRGCPQPTIITRHNYTFNGELVASRVTGHPQTANNGLFYPFTDHLGSTRFLTYGQNHPKSGQKVVGSDRHYTPFGQQTKQQTTDITPHGFTGHHENPDWDLIFMNSRFYLPAIGRFLTADTLIPDPTNSQSFNRYSYVRNNPLQWTDPTGHREEACASNADEGCQPYVDNEVYQILLDNGLSAAAIRALWKSGRPLRYQTDVQGILQLRSDGKWDQIGYRPIVTTDEDGHINGYITLGGDPLYLIWRDRSVHIDYALITYSYEKDIDERSFMLTTSQARYSNDQWFKATSGFILTTATILATNGRDLIHPTNSHVWASFITTLPERHRQNKSDRSLAQLYYDTLVTQDTLYHNHTPPPSNNAFYNQEYHTLQLAPIYIP
ncbi:MAG TPA: RHS repeat-associated core domain-containing protein, partial [Anaerolineae bacterium]|nr:RHS repeat-associated core domain-containing protein [Anaerolineae bacterium]